MLKKKAQEELQNEDHLTKEAIQEIVDQDVQNNYDGAQCKNIVASLGELHSKNLELRRDDDAQKFAESESALYEFIRTNVMPISADKDEAVLAFIEANGIPVVIELMDHPNTDISISCAVQFLKELTDEDVKYSQNIYEQLIKNDVLSFVLKVLKHDEEEQIILNFIENLIDISP